MSWTDERVELLRQLWLDGRSASQIAAELANGITRNAVIGKVHRLGLSGRAKAPTQSSPRQRPARPMAPRSTASRTSIPVMRGGAALAYATDMQPIAFPKPVAEDVVIPMSERVTIMELREDMCRWPLGDPSAAEFRYCGGKSPIGTPYCNAHSRMAYQPLNDRRRERDRERRALQIQRSG